MSKEKLSKEKLKRKHWKTGKRTETQPRPPHSYRGHRRNAEFGRKPVGNTKPQERFTFS